ncbi:hypothetical protein TWF696_006557 [Orbilia brochopaga]|uniref:DRBM domain-containing protein n=1 Tax=Orbilia brochopaga TaxID=3140254 RepID=A0AAV9UWP4_9PEZI
MNSIVPIRVISWSSSSSLPAQPPPPPPPPPSRRTRPSQRRTFAMSVIQSENEIFPFRAPEDALPALPAVDNLNDMRGYVATYATSGRTAFQIWKAMGSNVIKLQIQAFEQYTARDPRRRPWKMIAETMLSEQQLVLIANHYGLRDLLLPPVAERAAFMNEDRFTADLVLLYITGYTVTVGIDGPATWIRDMLAPHIEGICVLHQRKILEQGLQGVALLQNPNVRYTARPVAEVGGDAAQQPQAPAQPEEEEEEDEDEGEDGGEPVYELPPEARAEGTTQEEWQARMEEAVATLFEVGFKIHEAEIDIEGTKYYHVVLLVGTMEPVSMVRGSRNAAYEAALTATAEKIAVWF